MIERLNRVEAVVAPWVYAVSILVFVLRVLQMPKLSHWTSLGVLLTVFPLRTC